MLDLHTGQGVHCHYQYLCKFKMTFVIKLNIFFINNLILSKLNLTLPSAVKQSQVQSWPLYCHATVSYVTVEGQDWTKQSHIGTLVGGSNFTSASELEVVLVSPAATLCLVMQRSSRECVMRHSTAARETRSRICLLHISYRGTSADLTSILQLFPMQKMQKLFSQLFIAGKYLQQ